MSEAKVVYEVRAGVGTIALNRERVLNAIDLDVVEQLAAAAERLASDDQVGSWCCAAPAGHFARGSIGPPWLVAKSTNGFIEVSPGRRMLWKTCPS